MKKNRLYPDRNRLKENYLLSYPLYKQMMDSLAENLKNELENDGVRSSIKSRVKSFNSYYKKLLQRMGETNGTTTSITDILGIRIVCPFIENTEQAEDLVRSLYRVTEIERKGSDHTFREFGYQSTHFTVLIPQKTADLYPDIKLKEFEIQVRTILQDAWAEVEHELIYKAEFTPFDDPLRRKLAALNANLSLSDIIFQEIRDYQRQLHGELEKRRISFIAKVEGEKKATAKEETSNNHKRQRKSLVSSSASIDELLLDALYAHNNKDYTTAIAIYSDILKNRAEKKVKCIIYVHRGMAYFAEANYDKAKQDFIKASQLEPNNGKACYYLGIVHRVLGDPAKALEVFQKSAEADPYNVEVLFNLAKAFFEIGDYPAALEYCNKALHLEPEEERVLEFRDLVNQRFNL